jgi:hypothetical protein
MKTSQFIIDECLSQDKVKLLIYDLIVSEHKALPLLKQDYGHMNIFSSYIIIYHEAVVRNLL